MLRRIGLRGLDPALFERPKSGFVLPFERWLRLGLGKVMDQTMCDSGAVKSVGLNPEAVSEVVAGVYGRRARNILDPRMGNIMFSFAGVSGMAHICEFIYRFRTMTDRSLGRANMFVHKIRSPLYGYRMIND
jgi:hypothetical protein